MDARGHSLNFWANGPAPGRLYDCPGVATPTDNVITRTQQPMVTGTSVIGLKYPGGVVLAADTIGSYGSLVRFRGLTRIIKVNENTAVAVSGDYADYQYLNTVIQTQITRDYCQNDGFGFTPRSLFSWLTRIMYNRRSNLDPLWLGLVVGGMEGNEPFLGCINRYGSAFEAPAIATGLGDYMAVPLLRDALKTNPNMTEAQATETVDKAIEVLYYRDARAAPKYHKISLVEGGANEIVGPLVVRTRWDAAKFSVDY